MTDQFIAIDVETANSRRSSICQIGLVAFTGTRLAWEWSSLVNPECDFDGGNVRVHGISSPSVASAPTWPAVLKGVSESICGQILVSHSSFDCEAIHQFCARYNLALPDCVWLDRCAIARMCWPNLPRHDLSSVCQVFGIALKHHDALSDAHACGALTTHAISNSGISLKQWIARASVPMPMSCSTERSSSRRYSERIEAQGDPTGSLAGQIWVCTGDFFSGEAELVRLATSLGCDVKERFGKKASILVVGQRNPDHFAVKRKVGT
jgi:DNA polymerase-3 subunit epsilon